MTYLKSIKRNLAVKQFTKDTHDIFMELQNNDIYVSWQSNSYNFHQKHNGHNKTPYEPISSIEFMKMQSTSDEAISKSEYFISRFNILGAPDGISYNIWPSSKGIKDPVDLARTVLNILQVSNHPEYEFGASAVWTFNNNISFGDGGKGYTPGGKRTLEKIQEDYKTILGEKILLKTDFIVLSGSKKYHCLIHVIDIGIMPFRDNYSEDIGRNMSVHEFDYWNKQINSDVNLTTKITNLIQGNYMKK